MTDPITSAIAALSAEEPDDALEEREGFVPLGTNNGPGTLEVGTNDKGEVVINLPKDITGHIVFSVGQARELALVLYRHWLRRFDRSDLGLPPPPKERG